MYVEPNFHLAGTDGVAPAMENPMKSTPLRGRNGQPDFAAAQLLLAEFDAHRPLNQTKISLEHFAALVMLLDFGFLLTMFTLVRHSLPSLVRLPVSSQPI